MSSVQFSCSVICDSSRSHGPQHTRPPCPSPTPGVYLNSSPLSWWCHPTKPAGITQLSRPWSRDSAGTDHVADQVQITWLSMPWSRGYHALMTWLRKHWWRGWSGTDHMAHVALITCLSDCDQWLTGSDHGTVHGLITYKGFSCKENIGSIPWCDIKMS